jgi:deoxyribodipyrimidine photo-lyase
MTAIVWFRRDLRLANNPAWAAATSDHNKVTALFVLDDKLWTRAGPFRGPQLAAHLRSLDEQLQQHGGRLRVEYGDPVAAMRGIEADVVYWNADYTPYAQRRDAAVEAHWGARAVRTHGTVVHPPGEILTKTGTPYKVFTPFYRQWLERPPPAAAESGSAAVAAEPGASIPDAAEPVMAGGEDAAADRLAAFLEVADDYEEVRDRPDLNATSRLSADLKFGTISPLDVINALGDSTPGRAAAVRQLAWRDFWAQVLFHQPETIDQPMNPAYQSIRWRDDSAGFAAWTTGRTGYPIVDAGMRQLQTEGWIHNRVRMIVGSFLVKDLLIDWKRGERFFRHHLVDGDTAQNVGNWQWVAGTGADAAPYFRVFNPVSQSRKFDPEGHYIRRYVPELQALAGPHIHSPWTAPAAELTTAGISLGETYPEPIVDHGAARDRVLEVYGAARSEYRGSG